jgi:hypothetical protein
VSAAEQHRDRNDLDRSSQNGPMAENSNGLGTDCRAPVASLDQTADNGNLHERLPERPTLTGEDRLTNGTS